MSKIRYDWRVDGLLKATWPGVGFIIDMADPRDRVARQKVERRARSLLRAMAARVAKHQP